MIAILRTPLQDEVVVVVVVVVVIVVAVQTSVRRTTPAINTILNDQLRRRNSLCIRYVAALVAMHR